MLVFSLLYGKQNRPKDDLKIIEQIKLFYFDKKSIFL